MKDFRYIIVSSERPKVVVINCKNLKLADYIRYVIDLYRLNVVKPEVKYEKQFGNIETYNGFILSNPIDVIRLLKESTTIEYYEETLNKISDYVTFIFVYTSNNKIIRIGITYKVSVIFEIENLHIKDLFYAISKKKHTNLKVNIYEYDEDLYFENFIKEVKYKDLCKYKLTELKKLIGGE